MTNREILVTDETIHFASPGMNQAAEYAALQLHLFINFIQTIDSELTVTEATLLAGIAIEDLPEVFTKKPALIDSIKTCADFLRSKRDVK